MILIAFHPFLARWSHRGSGQLTRGRGNPAQGHS